MQLAGRLSRTTLGDVLGALYRGRATGILELIECGNSSCSRTHRIHLSYGLVRDIESNIATEARVVDTRVSLDPSGEMQQRQRSRLDALFRLNDARLAFRIADVRRIHEPVSPLGPGDFLHGRPRFRDAGSRRFGASARDDVPARRRDPARVRALRALGLAENADKTDVSRAFRALAARYHPDRFPGADERERAELMRRFAELSAAYHTLVA